MSRPRVRARTGCRVLAALLCVPLAAVLVATGAPAQFRAPTLVPAPVPPPAAPRIAFTDAHDEEDYAVESGVGLMALATRPVTHSGETSVNDRGMSASVSTVDEPHGEVYLTGPPDPDGTPTSRLTCDGAVESHPVVSPDGTRVAYASNTSGNFRIWLGVLPDEGDPTCSTTTRVQLEGAPGGENLWPSWVGDDRLVFSGTGLDPLGDIWIVDVGSAAAPVVDQPATRLTDGPAAETQPSHGIVRRTDGYGYTLSVVVLTTTQFRPDGSLGYLVLPEPDPSPGPTPTDPPVIFSVSSLWGDQEPLQGTEGVWSPDGTEVAYTTTERDPYGDVVWAGIVDASPSSVELGLDSERVIAAEQGRAESHPAWLPPPGEGEVQEWRYTVRTASGDVSDVVAADGSGRRTIAGDVVDGAPLDESTPTYSPDGTRIAYSRTASSSGGREIVTANSGGGDVVVLDTGRGTDDTDVEPAWSPDGTRIAFVRFPGCECSFRPSEIWVADVESRTAKRVTTVPEDTAYWDENPSWSPDGTRLVIARTVEQLQPDLVVTLAGPTSVGIDASTEVTATIRNTGRGSANGVRLEVRGPPDGPPEFPAPLGLEGLDDSCGPENAFTVACEIGRIGAGGERTVTLRVTGILSGTSELAASVSVQGAPTESDTGNNTAAHQITVTEPDVVVRSGFVTPATGFEFRSAVTVRFTVQNSGTGSASPEGIDISWDEADLVGGSVSVTVPNSCTSTSGVSFRCPVGTLGAHQTPVTLDVRVAGTGYGPAAVTGSVPPLTGEANRSNNSSTISANVCCAPINSAVPSALLTHASAEHAASASANPAHPLVVREAPKAPPAALVTTLWVIDADTGAGDELAGPGPRVCDCPEVIPGRGPAWSPDGLRVAYEYRGSVLVLHLADPHGDAVALRPGTDHPLIDVVTGFTAWSDTGAIPAPSRPVISVAEDPAWSPDGKQLAISAQPAGQPDQRGIYRIAPDGTGLTVVAQDRGPETEPAWQPFADLEVTLVADPAVVLIGTRSTLTATVRNVGPARTPQVVLELTIPAGLSVASLPAPCTPSTPQVVSCNLGTLAPGDAPVVKVPVTGTVVGTHSVRADVGSPVPDPVAANNSASAPVEVTLVPPTTDVSVTVRMDPDPGYVGGTGTLRVEISNSATGAATGIQVTISHPATLVALTGTATCFTGSACSVGSLAPGGRRTLTAPVRFDAAGTGALTASVTSAVKDTVPANDRATRTVSVKQPTVRILQPIGTPGSIAMVVGEQFPPGSRALLTWDHGLNQRELEVVIAADGTLPPTQVLVFRRDQVGPRLLLATPRDTTLYKPVSTPMLVTPRTVTPPADFVSRN